MCGIAGIVDSKKRVRGEQVRGMLGVMKHRGPDSEEVRCWDGVGLGHVRLSIVGLSDAGLQPMCDQSGRYWIVFNGEIYNFVELREQLEGHGHRFVTQTDTEVILAGFRQWGEKCLDRFNGMWAIAIYDQYEKQLFLARDRFGIKPLHFENVDQRLVFASEIKGVMAGGVEPVVDDVAVAKYFAQDTTDYGCSTMFKNIHSVAPGCYVVYRGGQVRQVKWWETADHLEPVRGKFQDRVKHFDALLKDATRLRLRNDVGTAMTLSGGMDSSTLFGMARHLADEKKMVGAADGKAKDLAVFSVTQPGQPSDESAYVQECLKAFGGKTNWIKSKPDQFVKQIDEVIWMQEQPVWSSAVFGFHDVYQHIAAEGYRVVLEGHGSDEMLAGYPYLVESALNDFVSQKKYGKAWQAAKALSATQNTGIDQQQMPAGIWLLKAFKQTRSLANNINYYRRRLFNQKEAAIHLSGDYLSLVSNEVEGQVGNQAYGFTGLKAKLYQAFHEQIMPTNLRVFDRASMAHSLEIRMPFMDHRVVQYLFSLDIEDYVSQGQSKHILREMAKPYVPKKVIQRKAKMGYSIDTPYWFKDAYLKNYLRDTFTSQRFREQSWLNHKTFMQGFEACLGDRFGWIDAAKVWKVLNVFLWRERFANSPAYAIPREQVSDKIAA